MWVVGGGLQLEVEACFFSGNKCLLLKTSRAAAARFTMRTCFDLDQTVDFFFSPTRGSSLKWNLLQGHGLSV